MSISCTVVIPTKSRPRMLKRAVNSAIRALPLDGEVVVVDDSGLPFAIETLQGMSDSRLRVMDNLGQSGASGARNFGVENANGEIIFFLDDDDEMLPHYCHHILENVTPHPSCPDYGFAKCEMLEELGPSETRFVKTLNASLEEGIVAPDAPFKQQIAGFGMGFWIRKKVFNEVGPIDEALSINEDTEYICRLMVNSKRAWFAQGSAVHVYLHPSDTNGELGHLTKRVEAESRAEIFHTILMRYSDRFGANYSVKKFLIGRFVKYAVRAKQSKKVFSFARSQTDVKTRFSVIAIALLRSLVVAK